MMNKFINCLTLLILIIVLQPQHIFPQDSQIDANKIIKKMDENLSFPQCYMKMEMINLKNSKEDRNFIMEVKYKRDKGTIIEFASPKREKGKKILSRGDSLWMVVPGVSRPVRLSLKESFMGTAMSNYDLTDYDFHNDFTARIIDEGGTDISSTSTATATLAPKDIFIIELLAQKKTTYDKIIVYVDKKTLLPVYMGFYTLSGNKIKEMDFTDVKNIGGKLRPMTMTMRDMLDRTLSTRVILLELEEKKFSDEVFSPQKLVE